MPYMRTIQLALIVASLMTIGTVMAQNESSGDLQGISSEKGTMQERRNDQAEQRAQRREQRRDNRAERTGDRAEQRAQRREQRRDNRAERKGDRAEQRGQRSGNRAGHSGRAQRVSAGRSSRSGR